MSSTQELEVDDQPEMGPDESFEDSEQSSDPFEINGDDERSVRATAFLEFFGRERRGAIVNGLIAAELTNRGLEMFPSIEDADYYGNVLIRRRKPAPPQRQNGLVKSETNQPLIQTSAANPIGSFISSLKSDAEELDVLTYGMTVEQAVELMKAKGRTKMPLFFDDVDRSTLIGTVTLTDCTMDVASHETRLVELAQTQVPVVLTNEKLSDWIPAILQHGFVYGRNPDGCVVQIYTTHDLAVHLNSIAQMFLRVHEIEELMRNILDQVPDQELRDAMNNVGNINSIASSDGSGNLFKPEEIRPAGQGGSERFVESLMFSDYMKCISYPDVWTSYFASANTGLVLDREKCLRSLNDARLARNRVMHISRQEVLETLAPSLECLAVWLRKIQPNVPA